MASMIGIRQVEEHMEVVDARGWRVGTIDRVDGDRITLAKEDSPDNRHHMIPASMVASVDQKVHLAKSRDEVLGLWSTE